MDTTEVDPVMDEIIVFHGREFQKFAIENEVQFMPVDEEEFQRLNDQHRVYHHIFDSRLVFPPIARLRKAMELGYGSAAWAIELAESRPDCEVG